MQAMSMHKGQMNNEIDKYKWWFIVDYMTDHHLPVQVIVYLSLGSLWEHFKREQQTNAKINKIHAYINLIEKTL